MNTVFFDIDSQLDYLYPAGALYVPKAERIVPTIAQLNRFAAGRGIPVVSTTDAHTENDPEFARWPHHCVAGTWGQRKAQSTLLDGAEQIIVEKQTVDVFQAPKLGRVIESLRPELCVVYGVVTEICVLSAVRGLLRLGKQVIVVTDAIETLNPDDSARALAEMRAGGAVCQTALATTSKLLP